MKGPRTVAGAKPPKSLALSEADEESLEPDLQVLFVEVDGFGTQTLAVTASGPGAWQADCIRPPGLAPGRHQARLRTLRSPLSNVVEFEMSDESGNTVAVPSDSLPGEAPELCSVEFQPPGDSRIAIGQGGSIVCYFKSPAAALGTIDVNIDIGGKTMHSHTISSLSVGVWQANILLDDEIQEGIRVRVCLGNGLWSETLPLRKI